MKGLWLPIIFIGVPLIEIALFVQIGGRIGLAWTIIIVIATAIAGTVMLRAQGLAVLGRAQDTLRAGDVPVESLIDGVFLLIAGILLLTPGFLTDFIGFLFFVPVVRQSLGRYFWSRIAQSGAVSFRDLRGGGAANGPRPGDSQTDRSETSRPPKGGPIIEGEIVREERASPETSPKTPPETSDGLDEQDDNDRAVSQPRRIDSPWRQ
ncbi:MAG: FxsA family protein [Fimbriimonadaceae bacterium]|nr:FxsA family protein [Alphaproteobacteria bacterium]